MERWKTLSRENPDFWPLLDGSFSQTHVALPVRSLNVGTASEQVTFEIKSNEETGTPSALKVIWLLIRPHTLILSLGPMLATLFFCIARGLVPSGPIAISSLLGVLLFHVAINLFNDYGDHIKGQDRLRVSGGSRVIQRGWARAINVKRAAWACLVAAALCGLPSIVLHFAPVAIVAGLALLVGLEFAFQKLRLKYRGWAEIMAFLLTGPFLTSGYAWAITGSNRLGPQAWLGCVFGAISLMYFHSANFENIMTDSQAGISTWATRTGFESSQKFFYFTSLLTLASTAFFIFAMEKEARLLPVLLAQALFLVPVSLRVRGLKSPLSSELVGLRSEALRLCLFTSFAFVGGYLWVIASRI